MPFLCTETFFKFYPDSTLDSKSYIQQRALTISSLRDDDIFTDVEIHCRDGRIGAHKQILASSTVVEKCLMASICPCADVEIFYPDISVDAMRIVLNCLYKGSDQFSNGEKSLILEVQSIVKDLGLKGSFKVDNAGLDNRPVVLEPTQDKVLENEVRHPRQSTSSATSNGVTNGRVQGSNDNNQSGSEDLKMVSSSTSPPKIAAKRQMVSPKTTNPVPVKVSLYSDPMDEQMETSSDEDYKDNSPPVAPSVMPRPIPGFRNLMPQVFSCKFCDKIFNVSFALQRHLAKVHKLKVDSSGEEQESETSIITSAIAIHLKNEKTLQVEKAVEESNISNAATAPRAKRLKSLRAKRRKRIQPGFECNICPTSFASYCNLLRHCAVSHHKEKLITLFGPFQGSRCNICDDVLADESGLLSHLVSKHKALRSEMPQMPSEALQHQQSGKAIPRPHQCYICSVTFSKHRHLISHYAWRHFKDQVISKKDNCPPDCPSHNVDTLQKIIHLAKDHNALQGLIPEYPEVKTTPVIVKRKATKKKCSVNARLNLHKTTIRCKYCLKAFGGKTIGSHYRFCTVKNLKVKKPQASLSQVKTEVVKYPCHICPVLNKSPQMLQWHLAGVHYKEKLMEEYGIDESTRGCPICDEKMMSSHNIVIHLSGKHNVLERFLPENVQAILRRIGQKKSCVAKVKPFKAKMTANFSCEFCQKKFRTERALVWHMESCTAHQA